MPSAQRLRRDRSRSQSKAAGPDSLAIPATSFVGRGSSLVSETAAALTGEELPTAPARPERSI